MVEPAPTARPSKLGLALLAVILGYAAWIHLDELGHPYLPGWDEAVHAAVAGNLLKHPLTPTLFDVPLVPIDRFNWQANHVWLHKPPLPFWQSALSMAIGGRGFFAFRLPSLLMLLFTLILLYGFGTRAYGEGPALLAAVLLSASPFGWLVIQGYHFGDITDAALLCWVMASVFALERAAATGRLRWSIAAGICQGLALLSKSALGLPPLGAAWVLWLGGKIRRGLEPRVRWHAPVLMTALGLGIALAWQLYTAGRWPLEYAAEQRILWAHVTSSFEGHGRSGDALFNSLVATLLSPRFVGVAVAGLAAALVLAWRRRQAAIALHALWLLGTLLPLLGVQTKVPALLFGLFPALALAAGWVIFTAVSRPTAPGWAALLLTPVLYPLAVGLVPDRTWAFLAPALADCAALPALPLQAALFLATAAVLLALAWPLRRAVRGSPRVQAVLGRAWGIALGVAALIPFWGMLDEAGATRQGFALIRDYNPVALTAERLRPLIPEPSALLVEGRTNGRQRPDLTLSFLTGSNAQVVDPRGLAAAAREAKRRYPLFLLTPLRREGEPLLGPEPRSGYWVYRIAGELPRPAPDPDSPAIASYADGPDLLALTLSAPWLAPGSPLHALATWRARAPRTDCATQVELRPLAGGPADPTFPKREHFPSGYPETVLHLLAPTGLTWGQRPLGTDLFDPRDWHPGEVLADAFISWVPRHLAPGSYEVALKLSCQGRELPPLGTVPWPRLEVRP